VFPVRYKLNSYILSRSIAIFKGLKRNPISSVLQPQNFGGVCVSVCLNLHSFYTFSLDKIIAIIRYLRSA
jgi:hypothetical protein